MLDLGNRLLANALLCEARRKPQRTEKCLGSLDRAVDTTIGVALANAKDALAHLSNLRTLLLAHYRHQCRQYDH